MHILRLWTVTSPHEIQFFFFFASKRTVRFGQSKVLLHSKLQILEKNAKKVLENGW